MFMNPKRALEKAADAFVIKKCVKCFNHPDYIKRYGGDPVARQEGIMQELEAILRSANPNIEKSRLEDVRKKFLKKLKKVKR